MTMFWRHHAQSEGIMKKYEHDFKTFTPPLWTGTIVRVEVTRKNNLKISNPLSLISECVSIVDSVKGADSHDIEERFRVGFEMVVKPRTIIIACGILAFHPTFVIIVPRAECTTRWTCILQFANSTCDQVNIVHSFISSAITMVPVFLVGWTAGNHVVTNNPGSKLTTQFPTWSQHR